MKVGILTYHYGSNYGGVLQCYALQQVLKGMGYEVSIINYIPHQNHKKFAHVVQTALKMFSLESMKALWHNIRYQWQSRRVFEVFRENYLNLTRESSHIEDFKNINIDVLIVGSDQLWGYPQIRDVYFLGWVENPHIKKVAYAVCSGYGKINEAYREEMAKQLLHFSAISVRSQTTKAFVKNIIGLDVPVVVDPTVLYDFNEFLSSRNDPYILTYILTDDIEGGNFKAIDLIKKKYPGLPVYSIIISDRYPRISSWSDKYLVDVTPGEWVNLIYNCSFLYTDSYHGALFAIKFGKPFIAYYSSDNGGRRLTDLQSQLNIHNVAHNLNDVISILDSKSDNPQLLLGELKKNSFDYINKNLIS